MGVILCVLVLVATASAAPEFPAPVGKVNDFADLLRTEDRQGLEQELAALERETSAEVALVTVRALDGRSVEEYANRLFMEWGIGKKDRDNGVLILVARDDRAMRIEVGYGLEAILPDGLAGAIIRQTFVPRFSQGQYRDGIIEGTRRVAAIVRRNETLTAEQRTALEESAAEAGQSWAVAAFLSIFVGVGGVQRRHGGRRPRLRSTPLRTLLHGHGHVHGVARCPAERRRGPRAARGRRPDHRLPIRPAARLAPEHARRQQGHGRNGMGDGHHRRVAIVRRIALQLEQLRRRQLGWRRRERTVVRLLLSGDQEHTAIAVGPPL